MKQANLAKRKNYEIITMAVISGAVCIILALIIYKTNHHTVDNFQLDVNAQPQHSQNKITN